MINYNENNIEIFTDEMGDISVLQDTLTNKWILDINCNVSYKKLQKNIRYFEILKDKLYDFLVQEGFYRELNTNDNLLIEEKDIEIYRNMNNKYFQVCVNLKSFNNLSTTYHWLVEVINELKDNPEKYYKN